MGDQNAGRKGPASRRAGEPAGRRASDAKKPASATAKKPASAAAKKPASAAKARPAAAKTRPNPNGTAAPTARATTAHRLSALDAAFLHLDAPLAPMHLGALAIFEPSRPVVGAHLVEMLEQRATGVPRLGQRVTTTLFSPGAGRWMPDPQFHARHHIWLHELPAPGGGGQLTTLASGLMAQPLDLTRPLWQLHVITGLADGSFAVLVKLHHALADGLRAIQLGAHLFDGFPAAAPVQPAPAASLLDEAGALLRAAGDLLDHPQRVPGLLADQLRRLLGGLPGVAAHLTDLVSIAADVLGHTRPAPHDTPLVAADPGDTLPRRSLAVLRLDLAEIRTVRQRLGGTVNDVLLALVTGGLRGWLRERGEPVDDLRMRALVPVSQRSGSGANQLSGYLCELPVHLADPRNQLSIIRDIMDRNKSAGPMRGPGALPVLAALVPAAVHRLAGPLTRRSANRLFDTVVTNVPVPPLPFTLHGAALREVYPIAPLAHGHALGVAASTYRGGLHLGLHADDDALPDLAELAGAVRGTLTTLARC